MSGNRKKDFEEDLKYGRFAEYEIAKFLREKGWTVSFADEYGFFDEDKDYGGPKITFIPTYLSITSIEESETSFITLVAPDIYTKKEKKSFFIEIKRRERFSTFRGDEVLYLNSELFWQYYELNLSFWNVLLFVYIGDEYYHEVYSCSIQKMAENIQFRGKGFLGFNKNIFKREKI